MALGATCIASCPPGTYNNAGVCTACTTLDNSCTTCNSSSTCLSCSSSLVALGGTCIASCPSGTYNNNGICTCKYWDFIKINFHIACYTLDNSCTLCNSSITCIGCSSSLVALGATCIASCPSGTYNNGGVCTACTTLDNSCTTCNSSTTCTACSSSLVALGASCISSCPSGTYNNNEICTCNALLSFEGKTNFNHSMCDIRQFMHFMQQLNCLYRLLIKSSCLGS